MTQHALKELMETLLSRGIEVQVRHPPGRRAHARPHGFDAARRGHWPYDHVFEMDEINPEFSTTDVALVIGANDVAIRRPRPKSSPIYGMPILEVSKARHIFFVKRSMKPGYSGVDNLLFYQDNCSLVFGDAKAVCEKWPLSSRPRRRKRRIFALTPILNMTNRTICLGTIQRLKACGELGLDRRRNARPLDPHRDRVGVLAGHSEIVAITLHVVERPDIFLL